LGKEIRKIAVIGTGLMGSGISQVFGRKGYDVKAFSIIPGEDTLLQTVESNMQVLMANGECSQEEIDFTLGKIHVTGDLYEVVHDADFVIECVPEDMEIKQNMFRELDSICGKDVILATNTSVMSITEISVKTRFKERVVGTHFWNPPFLIPLVEVVKAVDTSEDVMQRTMELMKEVGKHPIRVHKDVPGFVANRLQHALWREALSIVENGIADAKTVDESIQYGFGIRLPVLGPLENADMVGLDLTLSIHSYIFKHLESSTEPSKLLKEKVEKGELGFKAGKGFQEWTPAEAAASKKRLIEYLTKVKMEQL
jgi:3-hydroxybutyryl-CoA dehydrogenase